MSDHDYKVLLDCIAICERLAMDKALEHKSLKAIEAVSQLFDASADVDSEREEAAMPF